MNLLERARGALVGLAIGDALGMPTQSMSHDSIVKAYGGPIRDFRDAVDDQPIAPSMKAGSVTDDTDQAFILACRLIDDGGDLDVMAYAQDLLAWEQRMRAKGSLDLLGPSTKAALEKLSQGVSPELTGKYGTTNGGAMRAAPVGIAFAPGQDLCAAARQSCIVTHNTTQGIEATTLVAAVVSFGLEGGQLRDNMRKAISLVHGMGRLGNWSAKASVAARVEALIDYLDSPSGRVVCREDDDFAAFLRDIVGTSVEANESVPAAFAIAYRFAGRPFGALCFAASLGGDTDTMAAMAGAMLGAAYGPDTFGEERVRKVEKLNVLDVDGVASGLVALRNRDAR
ncbi:ADP-ribosylglycohydrolase family protein [Bifidobacterium sp. ESL0769]|uniref:ADP-ribosylglycohydrolase family protein n=1 Tax=Bifidobacterium sp. ESL0769 TaxID=2983229 RepID=UPI0023F90E62|nr:ADP-ribosylglycohydrolase family protein [Bifidobacterium sp. ESL0769]WEV66810.1 ADP-ribosylglycohydrolase family protein [Bifidobacterium sp. ESL0769]